MTTKGNIREASSTEQDQGSAVGVELDRLRGVRTRDVAVRFVFGAVISLVAGWAGNVWGARVGGLFLTFPAIMPASLTLIEQKGGRRQADRNASGAVVGGAALGAFALVAHVGLRSLPAAAVVALATLGWTVVAVGGYLLVRRVLDLDGDDEPFKAFPR